MKILIITGGEIDREFALDFLRIHDFDKVIAVDGGLAAAHDLGKTADLPLTDIVGDFDTVAPEILGKYQTMAHGPRIHQYIPEKDNTDTDIALRLAVEYCLPRVSEEAVPKGRPQIWILGGTGSRMDHVLANITMLLIPLRAGIDAYIQDATNRICLLSGTRVLEKEKHFGKYISLIPLTQKLCGVTLQGVKYPLRNHTVLLGESLCVSNEILADRAELTVEDGIAILLETKD